MPETVIRNIDDNDVFVLEGNSELRNKKMAMAETFYPQVDLPGNFSARVMMRVPPDLDTSGKYPMIVSGTSLARIWKKLAKITLGG